MLYVVCRGTTTDMSICQYVGGPNKYKTYGDPHKKKKKSFDGHENRNGDGERRNGDGGTVNWH